MKRKTNETVEEFVKRCVAECIVDIDVAYCVKHNIKYPSREDNETEDELWARLGDTKRTKAAFDYLTKNK